MENLKYAYMTNMWGLAVQYPKINDWNEWYAGDYSNAAYYLDWDKILKFYAGTGFKGIELMFHMLPYITQFFGAPKHFADFAKERGIEQITGTFFIAMGSENRENHQRVLDFSQKMIDFTFNLGGENMNVMPASGYFGVGPLSVAQLKNAADCFNEIGRRAADRGIAASIHSEFWCAINKYDLEQFIDMTDPRYVYFCLDTAQVAIMGFDPVKLYETYHDRIKYFHLKDTNKQNTPDEERFAAGAEFADDGTRWFWEPGGGSVDFPALWEALKKHSHTGWITLETDGTPDPLATMVLSKWYIDQVLSPIYK
jgi:inosose dehydratase